MSWSTWKLGFRSIVLKYSPTNSLHWGFFPFISAIRSHTQLSMKPKSQILHVMIMRFLLFKWLCPSSFLLSTAAQQFVSHEMACLLFVKPYIFYYFLASNGLKGILENHLLLDQELSVGNLIIPPICGEFCVLLGPTEASSLIQQIFI